MRKNIANLLTISHRFEKILSYFHEYNTIVCVNFFSQWCFSYANCGKVLALTGSQSVTTAVSQVTHRCSLSQPRGTFDRYPQFCQLIPSKTELKLLLSEINLHTMRQNAVCLCTFVCGFKQPYRAISYITDDCRLLSDVGRRPLRSNSNDTRKLLVPRTHNKLGDRSFSAAGPRLWNDLRPGLRHAGLTFDSFRRSLKTHLLGDRRADSFEFIGAIGAYKYTYLSI